MYTNLSTQANPRSNSVVEAAAVEHHEAWKWGWTRNAELWNGRLAMLGFFLVLFAVLAWS
ncbi:hypothetical protein C1752_01285 [Acaryochloris thomasi RCC1774]|uniref:High light inducible protein n=1 Tax=Acaryochloris thomasi RCC1774 TaxID=1764569 RepID=A0A2W1JM40_9CYAN|nr:chlorophyll a/b-binding protein [Acaryochloris thomasi]PZD74440.1 hypothetical protein C1752_01285 [Acaryochloris thomasi RCC1774]